MRCLNSPVLWCALALACWTCSGLTLDELQSQSDLTPEQFARHFAGFEFHFRSEVQSPDTFLGSRSGDCDDFAILAARILRSRGYRPQLIAVRMKTLVHVVCYIPEAGGYLDYNERNATQPLVLSDGSLADIARKVSRSFSKQWTSASEFTFEDGRKRLVKSVLPSNTRQPCFQLLFPRILRIPRLSSSRSDSESVRYVRSPEFDPPITSAFPRRDGTRES